jgi:hypothetical protein
MRKNGNVSDRFYIAMNIENEEKRPHEKHSNS